MSIHLSPPLSKCATWLKMHPVIDSIGESKHHRVYTTWYIDVFCILSCNSVFSKKFRILPFWYLFSDTNMYINLMLMHHQQQMVTSFVLRQQSWRGYRNGLVSRSSIRPCMCLFFGPSVTFLRCPRICRGATEDIQLKFGGWAHNRTPQGWQTFGPAHFRVYFWYLIYRATHWQTDNRSNLTRIWLVNSSWDSSGLVNFLLCFAAFPPFSGLCCSRPFAHNTFIELSWNLVGELITSLALLTFVHVLLNSRHFLLSDLPSSFCAFANKLVIRLNSNLVSVHIKVNHIMVAPQ